MGWELEILKFIKKEFSDNNNDNELKWDWTNCLIISNIHMESASLSPAIAKDLLRFVTVFATNNQN